MNALLALDACFLGLLLVVAVACFVYTVVPPLRSAPRFTHLTHVITPEIPRPVDAAAPVVEV